MSTHNERASTATGTLGTICWTVQLVPQIWYNYRRKDCTGFPPLMMFLWALCGIPFAIYFLVSQPSIAVQVQPVIFCFLCSLSWAQAMYYPPVKIPITRIVLYLGLFYLVGIGLEVGFILFLKPLYQRGIIWPDLIFGIILSVLLALGLLPPYFELAKRKGRVVGINFLFLGCDCCGGIFSMVSVLTGTLDIMGITLYAVCVLLELGIFTSQIVWYIRFRVIRKEKDEVIGADEELSLESVSGTINNEGKVYDLEDQVSQVNSGSVDQTEMSNRVDSL